MFSLEEGFVSRSVDDIKSEFREAVNTETGSSYNATNFKGSNWDRIANIFAQLLALSEQTSQGGWDFLKSYIDNLDKTEKRIRSSILWLQDAFKEIGINANFKQPTIEEAGMIFMVLELEPEALEERKQEISQLLINEGVINYFFTGEYSWIDNLPNGQEWRFATNLVEYVPVYVYIDLIRSRNALVNPMSEEEIKELFINNLNTRIALGQDAEFEKILTLDDVLFASTVNIGFKDDEDESEWKYYPKKANFNQKITTTVENIIVNIRELP